MSLRGVLVALTAAAVLGTAACGDDASRLPDDEPGPVVAATLSARLARTSSALTWTYTLRNDEQEDIAVFTGSSGDVSGGRAPSQGAWVVPRDDNTVEVSQRLLAPPPGGMARYATQFGLVLPAGATLTGTAVAKLPLQASHPYDDFLDPPLAMPDKPEDVVFCIGTARAAQFVLPGEPTATPDAAVPPGTRKVLFTHGPGGQHLVCAPPETLR